MGLSVVQGFTKSLAMTMLSEMGDKTFFAAAILAMRHPGRLVLAGCLGALIVMTILSAVVGWAAPNMISRKWTHQITTLLFVWFGFWSLWDAFKEVESEELAEVEKELNVDVKVNGGETTKNNKDSVELKNQSHRFLTQFFSPILLKAFSITFLGEWGDKSQLATIGLAADENPLGVVLGGILGQALCTTAAVLGGKSLAKEISEKIMDWIQKERKFEVLTRVEQNARRTHEASIIQKLQKMLKTSKSDLYRSECSIRCFKAPVQISARSNG